MKVIDWIWEDWRPREGGREGERELQIAEVKCSTLLLYRSFSVDVTHIVMILLDSYSSSEHGGFECAKLFWYWPTCFSLFICLCFPDFNQRFVTSIFYLFRQSSCTVVLCQTKKCHGWHAEEQGCKGRTQMQTTEAELNAVQWFDNSKVKIQRLTEWWPERANKSDKEQARIQKSQIRQRCQSGRSGRQKQFQVDKQNKVQRLFSRDMKHGNPARSEWESSC